MQITVIGSGYVGLVTGACFAEMGNDVLCFDVDVKKIQRINSGEVPIHEPGLDDLIKRNTAAGRLRFGCDVKAAVAHGVLQFIAVGTPPDEDGSADLTHVLSAARAIGVHMTQHKVIVDKSTVPVGTTDKVRAAIREELSTREVGYPFDVVSNPEFLKEGGAIEDFMRPARVVIGTNDHDSVEMLRELYAPFVRSHERFLVMDPRSAELTKYAANAMLATRISFMNELADLASATDADIESIRQGIGADPRIGYSFLYAGCGYGGSCFPKDVKALIRSAAACSTEMRIVSAVEQVNESQKRVLLNKILGHFNGNVSGLRLALWGLAFKPDTDDMREAPSKVIIRGLIDAGARITAYDPAAIDEARRIFGPNDRIEYAGDPLAACAGADALVIITEWKEFRSPNFLEIKTRLRNPVIFDGRNMYSPDVVKASGFTYHSIGRR